MSLIERMAKKKVPASWISEVKKMLRTIKNLQDDKSHYLGVIDTLATKKEQLGECDHSHFNWDLVYQCHGCGEIVPEGMAEKYDYAKGKLESENQELRELFVYFFGENYQELAEG